MKGEKFANACSTMILGGLAVATIGAYALYYVITEMLPSLRH